MTHIALVIGNGFDLDLGLRTSYYQFADPKNKEWEDFLDMAGTVIKQQFSTKFVDHMHQARINENWFDIEEEIFKFTNTHYNLIAEQIGLIREQFKILVNCLRCYIHRQVISTTIKRQSLANVLLHRLDETTHPVGIYTFNYTDCLKLCNCERLDSSHLHHLHGTLFYDMILGCRIYDNSPQNTQLDFMYKPNNDLVKEILKQNLTQATEVIIFGHSLNKIDYCYFKDFFEEVQLGKQTCKNLTIICKDNNSEDNIKNNLRENLCWSKIDSNIDVNFIYTDLWNNNDKDTIIKFDNLIYRIS